MEPKERKAHDTAEQVTGVNPDNPLTHHEWREYRGAKQDEDWDREAKQYDYLSKGKECPW